jgi:hypothetical protein
MIETTDLAGLKRMSNEFGAQKSNGHFEGCIGGMDGIALKIGCPQLEQDGVANPGDYFC